MIEKTGDRCPLCGGISGSELARSVPPPAPPRVAPPAPPHAPPAAPLSYEPVQNDVAAKRANLKLGGIIFLVLWILAQVGAFVALMNKELNLLYASIALAWIGGIGMAVCLILQKGQNLLWLIAVLAIWAIPIPLAMAEVQLPSSFGIMFWVAGLLLIQKLPDKLKAPAGAQPAAAKTSW